MVNGALWSLPVESTMYLIILAMGILGILYRKKFVTLLALFVLGVFLYINIHIVHLILPLVSHDIMNMLKLYSRALFYPLYFLVGSLYYINQRKIKYDTRLILLASIAWLLSFWSYDLIILTSFICLPYMVLGTGFKSIPYVNMIGKKADISYGLYIFHYPVQQTLINFISLDALTLLLATLVITVPLAWLSWQLIESKALSLKDIDFKKFGLRRKSVSVKS
jgi:peptidoglycan/LPS O-acetylase OafA/YrhL